MFAPTAADVARVHELSSHFSHAAATMTLQAHKRSCRSVAWDVTGTRVASGSTDSTIRVWNERHGFDVDNSYELKGHTGAVEKLCWSPLLDSATQLISVSSDDKSVKLWDLSYSRSRPYHSITLAAESINLCWSANGRYAAVASKRNVVTIIDVQRMNEVAKAATMPAGSSSSSNSRKHASADAQKGKAAPVIVGEHAFPFEVNHMHLAVAADPTQLLPLLVITTGDGMLDIYSITPKTAAETAAAVAASAAVTATTAPAKVSSLVAAAAATHKFTGLFSVQAHNGVCYSLAVDPTNTYIATGGHDALVHIFSLSSLSLLRTISLHESPVRNLSFSVDGLLLASCSEEKAIEVTDVQTGSRVHRMQAKAEVTCMAFMGRHVSTSLSAAAAASTAAAAVAAKPRYTIAYVDDLALPAGNVYLFNVSTP